MAVISRKAPRRVRIFILFIFSNGHFLGIIRGQVKGNLDVNSERKVDTTSTLICLGILLKLKKEVGV